LARNDGVRVTIGLVPVTPEQEDESALYKAAFQPLILISDDLLIVHRKAMHEMSWTT